MGMHADSALLQQADTDDRSANAAACGEHFLAVAVGELLVAAVETTSDGGSVGKHLAASEQGPADLAAAAEQLSVIAGKILADGTASVELLETL
jgi:hypothetical protein